jgi:2-isopropylmalate synthase
MKYKLNMDPEQVVERVREMVAYARAKCADVEFSPEDAGRSDPEFLYLVLGEAIKSGATTLNIPDTVGYTMPEEYFRLIEGIIKNTPGMNENVTVSVHCHDDLGLATANSLAGVRAGARQVEVTMNGIGERAGNTSLEEVVMSLKTRHPFYELETGIDATQISRISKLVSNYTGIVVQPNKAIVGANAFAHEAGIHQDGMLKHNTTYEIMRPEDVGVNQSRLVLGKHSGRHAFRAHLLELGHDLDEADEFYRPRDIFSLEGLQVACGTMGMPTATVRLRGPDGKIHTHASIGTGPVDATYKAIDSVVKVPNTLLEFNIHAITEGIDALGEVTVRVQAKDGMTKMDAQNETEYARVFGGHGSDMDIIVASAKAYLAALNKLIVAQTEGKSAHSDAGVMLVG